MKVQWSRSARKRLEEIEAYISLDRPETARKLIRSLITKTALKLSQYPQIGRAGRLAGTRELVYRDAPFLVVYTVRNDTITVLTVFHTSQQFPQSSSSDL
ncbi:addiction module antitoxin [Chlorobaculum limnaeum]|uniref:Addiction module antitoxin n=1 Tax=Chlorobaculum limnaeum TaxID=274537 RepID=A0A1D8D1L0_CHLLM|nr:addiction module antitoxin [Chlorobaculum limnaeum]